MAAVGWAGLGKLGLPCALALAKAGVTVHGHDISGLPAQILAGSAAPPHEDGIAELLAWNQDAGALRAGTLADVVARTDGIVFLAVQTPHDPRFSGETPVEDEPEDFDYSALVSAVRSVAAEAVRQGREITLAIVSTVLPGTCRRLIMPLLRGTPVRLAYGPYFTAMGTAVSDFTDPEFVLVGVDDPAIAEPLAVLYGKVHPRPVRVVSVESAELAKVAYNCFVSLKIVLANMLAEACDATGADVDEVTGTLALATRRILSPAYLTAGMGDGGACHPRDNLAMSWLARRHGLSADLMGIVSATRERQSQRLADLAVHHASMSGLPLVLLGKSYKPGIALTSGSPALLLAAQIRDSGVPQFRHWDHLTDDPPAPNRNRAVFVIATAHPEFGAMHFPAGSVVIDPHGIVPAPDGCTAIYPGRRR